jgi:hypothetical protein
LNLAQIPNHASRGQSEPSREFAPLFHFVNGAIGEGDHLAQLPPSDSTLQCFVIRLGHLARLNNEPKLKAIAFDWKEPQIGRRVIGGFDL